MKKLFTFTALLILSTCFLIFSCRKDSDQLNNEEVGSEDWLEQAKDWHDLQTNAPGVLSISKQKKSVLQPIWKEATFEKLITGINVLIVPSKQIWLENKDLGSLRMFVFMEQEGKITGKIIEIYGTTEYISSNKETLIRKFTDPQIENFTGAVITYDVNYKYISGTVYKNGNKTNASSKIMSRPAGTVIPPGNNKKQVSPARTSSSCTAWYWVTYDSDGYYIWDYLYTSCEGDTGDGEDAGGGGSGNNCADAESVKASYAGIPVSESISDVVSSETSTIREKLYTWRIFKGANYSFNSTEKGVHSKNTNGWVWQSLSHQNITKSGATYGISIVCNLGGAAASIIDPKIAHMAISFSISYALVSQDCPLGWDKGNLQSSRTIIIND